MSLYGLKKRVIKTIFYNNRIPKNTNKNSKYNIQFV